MKLLQFFPRTFLDDYMDLDDDLDSHLNLFTLSHPLVIHKRKQPPQSKKFRVAVNCAGYASNEIKTEIVGNKLIVTGRKGDKKGEDEDYALSEFRRRLDLPANVDTAKLSSFLLPHGQLVVEMPFKRDERADDDGDENQEECALLPKILPGENGTERAHLKVNLPKGVDPANLKVTAKDRDVIVRVEDKSDSSHFYYYRRCTMPEGANMDGLECLFDKERGNQLVLSAPVERKELPAPQEKAVPIEFNGKKQKIGQE